MNSVELLWITPNAEQIITDCARVSNPANQGKDGRGLIKYCVRNSHWSVFEMANMCLSIRGTRDITRQLLRHRSFSFQEFCISGESLVTFVMPNNTILKRKIKDVYERQNKGLSVPSFVRVYDETTKTFTKAPLKEVFYNGKKPTYKITFENGKNIICTKEHKFYTECGFVSFEDAVGLDISRSLITMSKSDTLFGMNGVPVHQDKLWLSTKKQEAIKNKQGVAYIAQEAGVSYHTIRKWLKIFDLKFSKKEVASYTPAWNSGLRYSQEKGHSLETIQKMRKSAKRGPESNLWRGGASRSERVKIADWCATIRAEKLLEFNYSCRQCESHKKLELHHIIPVATDVTKAYDHDNIEVLCHDCHSEVHGLLGNLWKHNSGNKLTTRWSKVKKIEYVGEQDTYDLEVEHSSHNYVANGILVHNSQRYAAVTTDSIIENREARLQDLSNRQNSIETSDDAIKSKFLDAQHAVRELSTRLYEESLANGVAKEQARVLLPEGLTMSHLYVNGTIRSWIHYCSLREGNGTQKEHIELAKMAKSILIEQIPVLSEVL